MAESSKDELLQLIKRFGAYLTVKMSSLFPISLHNMNSRSIGAIAGFAVAIVFTWRLLRSPSGPPRRQPKRQAPASSSSGISSNSNATLTTTGVSPSQGSRAQNVVDEFFQPVKPTLGQIVRQKLSEGRKVTCRLLGVVLEESTPEELQKQVTVRYSVLEVLLEITKFCDLYLMERVLDDESESILAYCFILIFIAIYETILPIAFRKRFYWLWKMLGFLHLEVWSKTRFSSVAQRMDEHLLFGNWNQIGISTQILTSYFNYLGLSSISFTSLLPEQNDLLLMCSTPHPWNSSLDVFDASTTKDTNTIFRFLLGFYFPHIWVLCRSYFKVPAPAY